MRDKGMPRRSVLRSSWLLPGAKDAFGKDAAALLKGRLPDDILRFARPYRRVRNPPDGASA
ncbi:hypothetical protein [Azorhizobium oxalatiphilum]|uniref:hypothetical protein n=1 Tax=Azorhizobium oxalatiphilum TaxID=980631 RepID=UPI001668A58B|nr:hypothetical protein [Azorhizobium oxalatiphilum]